MRTTLTLEDEIAAELKKLAFQTGRSFKDVVNSVLRAGLSPQANQPEKKPYRLSPISMGTPNAPLQLDQALQIAAILEDEEIQRELELRK